MPSIRLHPSTHQYDRGGALILAAVIHATAGKNSLGWLTSNPEGVSAHALVTKAGEVIRMVPDGKGAGHVGNSEIRAWGDTYTGQTKPDTNDITLGVEIENLNNGADPYPDAQVFATAWLLADWLHRYPDIDFLKHRDVDAANDKTDPYALPWRRIHSAMAPWLIAPPAGSYRVTARTPVYTAPDVYAPVALGGTAVFEPGRVEQMGPLTSGQTTWLHVSSGLGFVPRLCVAFRREGAL